MPVPSAHRLRRFRFERPQQLAALLLLIFAVQCLAVISRTGLSSQDYDLARCGREMWEKPSPLAGYFTTCGNIHDGTLAYRAAGLPLTIQRIFAGQLASTSTWEMRHEISYVHLLMTSPFLLAGLALGACLWWVTRRLYGNTGGYIALALYCFSPVMIHAASYANNEILAAFGLFSLVYTAIGVAHALQGPRRKWRPRILLLALIFGFVAAAHIAAFLLGLLFAALLMAWVAEGRRALLPTLLLGCTLGGLLLLFASYAFRPDAFSYVFRSAAARLWLSTEGARVLFTGLPQTGFTLALVAALALYAALRRSRYFGNTAPLLVALPLVGLITTGASSEPWLWAIPFLLTFIAGVFADVLETQYRRLFLWTTGSLLVLQAVVCLAALPSLTH